jgi:peptidoglycan hydrolase-like protein with peptidoglycan-binding domain
VRKVIIAIIALAAITVSSCGSSRNVTPIQQIIDSLGDYAGKEVNILGNVTDRLVIQRDGVLTIADETGSISVHTTGNAPEIGERVMVSGVVKPMFKLGSYGYGPVIEAHSIRAPHLWESSPSGV